MALGGGSGGGSRAIEAGRAVVRLGVKDDMSAHLKGLAGKFLNFGKSVLGATGVGGLVAGAVGGFGLSESLDELTKMRDVARAFGASIPAVSGLFGVLKAAGGEFKENVEGVIQFSDAVSMALEGGDNQGTKLFKGLTVSAKELQGLGIDEQFYRTLAAIRELPQPLQEAKLALLGGTDSMKQWQKLLVFSSAEVREMAKNLGFGSAELEDAAAASKAMAQVGAELNRAWQQLVIATAPAVVGLAKAITDGLRPMAEWAKGRTWADVWDELVARAELAWADVKLWALEAAVGIREGLIAAVTALPAVVNGVVDGVVGKLTTVATAVGVAFAEMFDGIKANFMELLGAMAAAAANPLGAGKVFAELKLSASMTPQAVKTAIEKAVAEATKFGHGGMAELEKLKKEYLAEVDVAKSKRERDDAQRKVDKVMDRIEAERKRRRGEDLMDLVLKPGARAKMESVANSVSTFGAAGGLLAQGFGVQAGKGAAKETVDELKKANVTLRDVVKAVQNSVPRFL